MNVNVTQKGAGGWGGGGGLNFQVTSKGSTAILPLLAGVLRNITLCKAHFSAPFLIIIAQSLITLTSSFLTLLFS